MSGLVPAGAAVLAAREVARGFASQSMSAATVRAYRADWAAWEAYAGGLGVGMLPADPVDVAAFIASMAGTHAPNTIRRRLSAIARMHALADLPWQPGHRAITSTLRGLLRTHGRPDKRAAPIGLTVVRALVGTCDGSAAGLRDRAMLLLGFAGALRRSELVGLRIQDLSFTANGLRVHIRRSKTDQTGEGHDIGIPAGKHAETCPVSALRAWLYTLQERAGPLFRRIQRDAIGRTALLPCAVWDILERRARLAGVAEHLTPHGLRAGFITEAYGKGVRDDDIMRHSRHRDLRTMRGYVRRAGLLTESPAGVIGL